MLLTTCPNCQAQFKVSPDQLNVRSGRVMCGRCRHVFNSFESLQRVDSTLGELPPEPPAPPELSSNGQASDEPAPLLEDFPPAPAPRPAAIDLGGPVSVPAFLDASQPPRPPESNTLSPYRNAPLLPRETAAPSRSAGWTLLVVIAAGALLTQVSYVWRTEIVTQYPPLRPHFEKACEWAGCSLPWARDPAQLKVESSDLIEELGAKGRYLLTATIANRATVVQDYPHLELSLTDVNNQTLARRVLSPDAYLGKAPARAEGLGAGASAQVNVRIDSQLPNAAGYHVELFFP